MNSFLALLAVVVGGLMVGVELSVAAVLNPIFERLPDNAGLAGRADGARMLGAVMPFWYSASIVATAAAGILGRHQSCSWTMQLAAVCYVLSIVMSVVLLVPINNRAKGWTPDNAPADWREQLHRWDAFHFARLAVILTAFVLSAAGAALGR